MYVCMYVLIYFSGTGVYHRYHIMKNILDFYHSHILPMSVSLFFLLRDSSIINLFLMYIRICFFLSNSFCWGTYFLKIFLILRKKVISGGHWFYVPPTEFILWFDLVGHSIVIRSMYFINFGKSFYFYDLYVFLFGRGYICICIISTFNRCFRLCSFFDGVIDWTVKS